MQKLDYRAPIMPRMPRVSTRGTRAPLPTLWQPGRVRPSTTRISVGLAQVDAAQGDLNANIAKARKLLS